jgi:uncharacterized protein with FMN-binding domain
MNRKIFLVLTFTLLIALLAVGCGQTADPAEPEEEYQYQNGVYFGASTASRGYLDVEVTIENDEIVEVIFTEYTNAGVIKDENYSYDGWQPAIVELQQAFKENNSDDADVVSGATSTSNKAIEAVGNALRRAEGYDGAFDGVFMGFSDADDRGYTGIALVTVQGGNITEVELLEANAEGEFKDEDYSYEPFFDAVSEMQSRFIEANGQSVDLFSGATGSSEKWIQAVERALNNAGIQ